ncbi:MAG: AraC family transcriptional regulator [Dysgonamonadaceae bacterium]|nr:AraC family transcriptional regulator [Dysgonamonadaceae bacterium]MDD4727952.1 AraC family transcriptional regulator [Dysgonamonadaceae bacterium]
MRYNDFGMDFKYLLVNERDKRFGLTVNTVGFQPIPPNTVYPSTDHPKSYYFNPLKGRILSEYQILYISKGEGSFRSESTKKTSIKKGHIILLFPGQWHTYCPYIDTGWNEYYIGFQGVVIDELVNNEFISLDNQVLDVGVNEELVNLFSNAIQSAKDEKKASQQYLAGIVLHIIGMTLSFSQNREFELNDSEQIIERAKVIMTENIHRQVNIQQIAANLGTSYSWFRKAFKEYTGFAPAQYFQELKLRKAKELLTEKNLTIKEIAFELDFSSYEYFLSFFKKKVGVTPTDYRG